MTLTEHDLADRLARLAGHAWTEPTRRPAPPRRRRPVLLAAAAAVVLLAGGAAVVLARSGTDHSAPPVATDPAPEPPSDGWRVLPAGPADGRTFPAVVWMGDRLLVQGGEVVSEQEWTEDGAVYDPATDAWRGLDVPLQPVSEHAAVWTGSEVLVCCGRHPDLGGRPVYGRAAAYDPATDEWRPIAPAPFEAEFAGAVWTGEQMLVVGGMTGGGLGDVLEAWAYDPATDEWTRLADPLAEIGPSPDVVWTGDRLLVWSRWATAPPMAYDPATDEWTAFPQPPEALWPDLASMVWTGDELVIWGVSQVDDRDAVGARLDPERGTWRALADDPLPPVDWFEGTPGSQAAVWTGEEVVIWTASVGTTFGSGEAPVLAYDPERDTWRALPPAPAGDGYPPHDPPMIWTGEEVLVYGDQILAIRP